MRIDGLARFNGPRATKAKRDTGGSFVVSHDDDEDSAGQPHSLSGAGGLSLGALQTLQALDEIGTYAIAGGNATVGLGTPLQAKRHAQSLLDDLAALQADLAGGRDLHLILARIREKSDSAFLSSDPTLNQLLAQIELRVAVELARHEQRSG